MRPQVALAIIAAGARLSAAGLSPGSTGNISVREGDRIHCTSTGVDLGALGPRELSELDPAGEHISGPIPTKEVSLHLAAYGTSAGVGAVIHLHSPFATAVSCLADIDPEDAILPFTPYLSMRAGMVGLVPYFRPGESALGEAAQVLFRRGHRCLLLGNHGSVIAADSLDSAISIAFELEESARLQLLLDGHASRVIGRDERSRLFPR